MSTSTPAGLIACSRCGKPASLRLAYARQDLCGECLAFSVEKRVSRAVREYHMLQKGDRVAVGVSGGKDSAALLYSLTKIARAMHGVDIVPILIDEGIEGYRNLAIPKAEKLCQMLGLELHVFRYKDAYGKSMDEVIEVRDQKREASKAKSKDGTPSFAGKASCSYCGVFRKTLLNTAAKKLKCNKMAIGHNADDTGQTFLMNLLRNEPGRIERTDVAPKRSVVSSRKALDDGTTDDADNHGHNTVFEDAEHGPGYIPRIKPLLYVLEKEAALYCAVLGLPFHLAECPYANEAYRGEVKDFLNVMESKYPGTKFNTLYAFLAVKKRLDENPLETETLTRLTGDQEMKKLVKLKRCTVCGEPSPTATCKACEFVKSLS